MRIHTDKILIFFIFFLIGISVPMYNQVTGEVTIFHRQLDEVVAVYRTTPLEMDRNLVVKLKLYTDEIKGSGTIQVIEKIPKEYQVLEKNLEEGALFDEKTNTLTWNVPFKEGQKEITVNYQLKLREQWGKTDREEFQGHWKFLEEIGEVKGDKSLRDQFFITFPRKFLSAFGAEF